MFALNPFLAHISSCDFSRRKQYYYYVRCQKTKIQKVEFFDIEIISILFLLTDFLKMTIRTFIVNISSKVYESPFGSVCVCGLQARRETLNTLSPSPSYRRAGLTIIWRTFKYINYTSDTVRLIDKCLSSLMRLWEWAEKCSVAYNPQSWKPWNF